MMDGWSFFDFVSFCFGLAFLSLFGLFSDEEVLFSPGWPQTRCVANDDLKLLDLPSLLPDFWNYRLAPPTLLCSSD